MLTCLCMVKFRYIVIGVALILIMFIFANEYNARVIENIKESMMEGKIISSEYYQKAGVFEVLFYLTLVFGAVLVIVGILKRD